MAVVTVDVRCKGCPVIRKVSASRLALRGAPEYCRACSIKRNSINLSGKARP